MARLSPDLDEEHNKSRALKRVCRAKVFLLEAQKQRAKIHRGFTCLGQRRPVSILDRVRGRDLDYYRAARDRAEAE